jgi:hypothetical protein
MSSTKLQRLGETTFNKIDKIVSPLFLNLLYRLDVV